MSNISRASSIYGALDRVSVPDAAELDSEVGWQQFQSLQRQFEVGFQPTLPVITTAEHREVVAPSTNPPAQMPTPAAPTGDERDMEFLTEELEGSSAAQARRTGPVSMTLALALLWAQQERRTAPVAPQWGLILAALEAVTGEKPIAPSPRELAQASAVEQRIALRRLIRWADAHGCLNRLMYHLQEMPASGWMVL